jgi:hypothetical protein
MPSRHDLAESDLAVGHASVITVSTTHGLESQRLEPLERRLASA